MMGADVVAALPAIIRIGPFDYRIEVWSTAQAMAANSYGEHSSIEMRISVQSDFASPIKAVDTFLHEVSHAIFWAYNIVVDRDDEERVVTRSAIAWTQIYRDNPWLLEWIGNALRVDDQP